MFDKKLCVKECFKLVIFITISIIICTFLMLLLYSMPTDRIYENAKESVSLYDTQMIRNWSGNTVYSKLDNFTDALMINIALYRPYESDVENAMLNSYIRYEGLSNTMQQNLVTLLTDGTESGTKNDYARYWHGYLVYLIPGLIFFNVGEMKMMMMIVQMFLLSACLYEFGKINFLYSIIFMVIALFINPITTVLTFQVADIYIITLVFTFIILRDYAWLKEKDRWKFLFALNGVLVAFLDFFTYPLVAFGVPLLTFFIVEDSDIKKGINNIAKMSFFWAFGYAGMWIGKWFMALFLTGNNIVSEGVSAFKYRMVGIGEGITDVTYLHVLKSIWDTINEPFMGMLFVLTVLILAIYALKKKHFLLIRKEKLCQLIPISIISILPFVYYFIVRNHVLVHPWLEYRELAVTIWGVAICLVKLILPESEKK